MGHSNPSPPRRGGAVGGAALLRRCTLIDLVSASFFSALLLFLFLAFTPLGDPLAASGRRTLARRSAYSARQREKIISAIDSVGVVAAIEPCPAEEVDQMPCEDPRRSIQLDRYMNFYRERHCPVPGELPLCLVPPPQGYRVRIPWPESLHKMSCSDTRIDVDGSNVDGRWRWKLWWWMMAEVR